MNTRQRLDAKLVAILVVYSQKYASEAIFEFVNLMRRTCDRSTVLIVNNNPLIKLELPPDVVLLQGDNKLYEFGAWQAGLDYFRDNFDLSLVDSYVFGNDTFCFHRRMGFFEKFCFSNGIKSVLKNTKPKAIGELSSFNRGFVFDDQVMTQWICTYLFCINSAGLSKIAWKIHQPFGQIQRWVPGGSVEQSFFASDMDPVLKHHLIAWLFGREGLPRWHKGASLSDKNSDMMRLKAFSIICEKMLTANLLRFDVQLESVFSGLFISKLRRILMKWDRLLKRLNFPSPRVN